MHNKPPYRGHIADNMYCETGVCTVKPLKRGHTADNNIYSVAAVLVEKLST